MTMRIFVRPFLLSENLIIFNNNSLLNFSYEFSVAPFIKKMNTTCFLTSSFKNIHTRNFEVVILHKIHRHSILFIIVVLNALLNVFILYL